MLRDVLSLVMWPFSACDRFQLGNALQRFLGVINRTYFTLILKMTNLINCTDKLCYLYENFQNTEAATEGVLKKFTKFTGKHLCQSLFFNKVAGLQL